MELPRPQACVPPRWARGGHPQTVFGHLLPSGGDPWEASSTHEIELPDGDRLVARLVRPPAQTRIESEWLALLFHGLGGSSEADYIRRTATLCAARGYSVLAVNHRGCGAGEGLARGTYHSGRSDDVAACLAWADRETPHAKRVVIGFSLSGNATLLALASQTQPLPDAAIAVNPPIDLAAASRLISAGFNRAYEMRFVHHCRQGIRSRSAAGWLENPPSIPLRASLRDVDELVTAPLGGFRDADDYYARCSTHRLLNRIQVPAVILSSRDDPFVPYEAFESAELAPKVHLHLEAHGGHMGYLAARPTPLGTRRWLDYALDHYLANLE